MTNSKEWVTIKLPKEIRDKAREDPRTYGQIMQAGLENEPFAENAVDVDELASQLADRVETTGGIGPEQIAREVSKSIDYAELANKTAEELEGRMR